MGKKQKRYVSGLLAVVMTIAFCLGSSTITFVSAADEVSQSVESTTSSQPNIWIVGDSTVCGFTDNYYYPRYGWGTQLGNYLDGSFTIKNLALSGRSSTSYTLDPEYKTLLSGMKSGDFLFIGFGHNDEKAEEGRYTNPNGSYTDSGSFANSLYENYIKQAKAAGVTVVLCTPIVRRTATGVWSDSNLHITTTTGSFAGGDYSKAIRDLGTALNIPVVDMTSLTKSLYDTLGAAETLYLHAWTSSKEASVDNTHTNIWGAKYNAYLMTNAIKGMNISGLSSHIIEASAPTKAGTLVTNPNYKETSYGGEIADSTLWKNIGIWKGTVFGNVGGNPSTTNQKLEQDSDGNMHIAVLNNKGKISSTVDGVAMYYYKVPASSTFTLTAKAKINKYDLYDQVSFGLMARDEIYTDKNITTAIGDYVAAGPLKITQLSAGGAVNCFARKNGVLTQGGTCVNSYALGDTVNLKIESNSDGYACTFGNEPTVSAGFDFKLTSIDADNVYVGMFVARNADITFSDIKLIVDGVEVKAVADVAADYTAVNAAIAAANTLKAADYKDFTVVTAAVNAVQTGLLSADQAKVDAMAKAINDAVAALVKAAPVDVAADYTAVNAAIAAANTLKAADYKDYTAVTAAVNAVQTGLLSADQAKVDAMAKAINDAVVGLVKAEPVVVAADYTAVNAAIAAANILKVADYKDFTAVTAAVKAVQTGLLSADQAKVDAMAKAINDAVAGLVKAEPVVVVADYTAVNAAIAAANLLKAADYKDFTAVTTAVKAVQTGLFSADQAKVDAMAKAINDAVAGLVKAEPVVVAADYTAVNAAIAAANTLKAADYKDFTAVTAAVKAVQTGLLSADQAKVDAMAKTINDAVAALVKAAPVAPAEIVAKDNEKITSDQILDAAKNIATDKELLIDVTKGSVSEISSDVFKTAAEKKSTVIIKSKDCTWEFSNLSTDTTASLKSPVVTIGTKIAAITDKLATVSAVDTAKVVQLSFEHSGALPGEAKVTLSVKDKYATGTTLHFYYYNTATGLFESMQTCTVDANGTVAVSLTHCSEYILTTDELPQALLTVADNSTSNTGDNSSNASVVNAGSNTGSSTDVVASSVIVATGDRTPVAPLICLSILSAGVVLIFRRKKSVVK